MGGGVESPMDGGYELCTCWEEHEWMDGKNESSILKQFQGAKIKK